VLSILAISILATVFLVLFVVNPVYRIAFITAFRAIFLQLQVKIGAYAYSGEGFLTLMVIVAGGLYLLSRGIKGAPRSVLVPFIIFFIYCTMTVLFAGDLANFLKKDLRLLGYIILYLVVFRLSQSEKSLSILKWAFFIAIIVTTIPAIYVSAIHPEQYTALENKPALGGIMKKNNFGFFSCYMLFFLFFMQETVKRKSLKNLTISMIGVQFVLFVFSFTRAAWVGFIGALPAFFALSKNKKKMLLPFFLVIVICVLLFPILYFGLVRDVKEKKEYGMSSLEWRIEYAWPASIKAFKEKPILGWGLGNDLNALTEAAGLRKTSHNDYLLVMVETGLVGILLYLWLLGAILLRTYREIKDSDSGTTKSLQIASLSIFTAFIIGSMAEHLLQTPGATGYVITILGMAHSQSVKKCKYPILEMS
jgi:O-antigen ligase